MESIMKNINVVIFMSYVAVNSVCFAASRSTAEKNLASFLLNGTIYNPAIRPVEKYADTLVIKHGLTIAQLIKLDEKSQVVTTSVLLHLKWHDRHLIWNPALYGGITEFNVDIKLIWYPMIELFNNADDSLDTIAIPRATVAYDGSVTAIMPRILKSTCKIKVKDFPFDRQICELRFGSFQFDSDKMDIQPLYNEIRMDSFQSNGEWNVTKSKVERGLVYHAFSEKQHFSQLSYKLQLDRKPLYYITNFLIPCILIALITVLLFLIPSDTGEQMAVGVTILLSLAVFFLLLEDKMPETSDNVPLIGKYFACTIVEASLAVGAVCMVLCFHHHDPTDVPVWVRKYILGYLATILRIKTKENTKNSKDAGKGKGSFKLTRMKKSTIRKNDEYSLKVARKRLRIWQAKATAKRLRREKHQRETANLFALNDGTKLTSISQEDLQGNEQIHRESKTNKAFEESKVNKKDAGKEKRNGIAEGTPDQSDSRRSSILADEGRVLIKNVSNSHGIDQLNIMSRVIKMKDNVRDRFRKKYKDKQAENDKEVMQNTLFKIKPASDWLEADHKSVKLMADTIKEGDIDDMKRGEWREVGKVINYFMMWLYIFSSFMTFFALFGPIFSGKIPDFSL